MQWSHFNLKLAFWNKMSGTVVGTAAMFTGNSSFVELSQQLLPHKSSNVNEVIELVVTTTEPDAIIFWHGQTSTTPGRGKDYVAVVIEDGHAVFRLGDVLRRFLLYHALLNSKYSYFIITKKVFTLSLLLLFGRLAIVMCLFF